MKNVRLLFIIIVTAVLLLVPLIAMQFTEDVNWALGDFVVAAVLLFGTGLLCEIVLRKVKKSGNRIAICIIILIILLLVWAELAVGIFGTPFSGS